MVPDEFLARNVSANTDVKIIAWKGHCEVHEKFTGEDVRQIRDAHPGTIVLAHPECPPDVLEEADFAGSTSALSNHVKESGARKVVLLTECSMSDNVAADNPGDHPADNPALTCDLVGPLLLRSPVGDVDYRYVDNAEPSPMFMGCELAIALDDLSAYLRELDIVELVHIGTYNCRVKVLLLLNRAIIGLVTRHVGKRRCSRIHTVA